MMNRRDALKTLGTGFGMIGLANTIAAATGPHFTPKAKSVAIACRSARTRSSSEVSLDAHSQS